MASATRWPCAVKRIVCLANSRKMCGRCVVGKDEGGNWVRPVSDRVGQEISERERRYEDQSEPSLLDVIDVPVLAPRPTLHQTENWLLDARRRWVQVGRAEWKDLFAWTDYPLTLWINGCSSFAGKNDRVNLENAKRLDRSLYFLHLSRVRYRVFTPGGELGNRERRVQAAFRYQKVNYRFWVTDPVVEMSYLDRPDGEYAGGECYVTVSLGEPFLGHCYKLIAAVITART